MHYKPPYTITTKIVKLVSEISEKISDIKHIEKQYDTPKLRKKNRVRSITGSLQIEGNTLSEEKVTAMMNGKRVIGEYKEILEVEGAIKAYANLEKYDYTKENDLLLAHKLMMGGILTNCGNYRGGNVGVGGKDGVAHIAPPPNQVPKLMGELFDWLKKSDEHRIIKSCVFHYEFEFIHPFSDGNGRIGRLWQSVILKSHKDFFAHIPIESIVRANQQRYYEVLEASGSAGESTPFIEYMLEMIRETMEEYIVESHKSDQKSNQKSDQKILEIMRENPKITIYELMAKMGMSESGIKKVIKKLKSEDKIQRVGGTRGHWEILEGGG